MATINELKVKYANEILSSTDKDTTTQNIINKINTLKYDNGTSISNEDTKNLVDGIIDLLTQKYSDGKIKILFEKENINYLTALKAVSAELAKSNGGK